PTGTGPDPGAKRLEIEAALRQLDPIVDEVIRRTAMRVLVGTALSQNGRLDSLISLVRQLRMIWQIAGIYSRRGTVGELARLYGSVAMTAFLAGELPDLDLSDEMVPLTATVANSLGALTPLPGIRTALSILGSSLLKGSTNAFSTLQVGIIAK